MKRLRQLLAAPGLAVLASSRASSTNVLTSPLNSSDLEEGKILDFRASKCEMIFKKDTFFNVVNSSQSLYANIC